MRKTATGSLVALSISIVLATRRRSCTPLERIRKNTAAASVEATMAPTRRPSAIPIPRTSDATSPVTAAVTTTPIVDSRTAGASTPRKLAARVRSPPSNRMIDRASEPMT